MKEINTMEIILKSRGAGKTTDLIRKSAKSKAYIICFSQDEAHNIVHLANNMGLKIPFPISYREFLNEQYYAKGIKSFLIDNADGLLQFIAKNVRIEAITLTKT